MLLFICDMKLVFWPIMQQQISFSMQIFKTTSHIFPVQLVVEESCSSLPSDEQHSSYPSNCSLFLYFSLPSKLFLLLYAQLSGVLAVANLHLPCSFHPSFSCKSGNNLMWAVFLKSLSFALATAKCGNVMNRYRSAHWCIVASGSWLFCSICLLYSLALFFWVMSFVFWETAVNTKSKVPLFHLINLFALLIPNTWEYTFLWSEGPFNHLTIAINLWSVFTFNFFSHFAGTWGWMYSP